MAGKPRVGISACLLGQKVRWDGGHKQEPYLKNSLGRHVEWIPICPEKELGFSVPRDPLQLKGDPQAPRLVVTPTAEDYTERMRRWADKKLHELEDCQLCGFVFTSGSPSCGLRGVKVSPFAGGPPRRGTGVFARAFVKRFPNLPVMGEDDLSNGPVRERFIERMFVARRWWEFVAAGGPLEGLKDFHVAHELLVASHDPQIAASLARLVSRARSMPRHRLLDRYAELLMSALSKDATPPKNAQVLMSAFARLEDRLSSIEAGHVREVIGEYRKGDVPRLVPVVLLKHYVQRFADPYLVRQRYFDPYPVELGLRART